MKLPAGLRLRREEKVVEAVLSWVKKKTLAGWNDFYHVSRSPPSGTAGAGLEYFPPNGRSFGLSK
jgi:hypothetical protein